MEGKGGDKVEEKQVRYGYHQQEREYLHTSRGDRLVKGASTEEKEGRARGGTATFLLEEKKEKD